MLEKYYHKINKAKKISAKLFYPDMVFGWLTARAFYSD